MLVLWDGDTPVAQLWAEAGTRPDALLAELDRLPRAAPPPAAAGEGRPTSASLIICTRDRPDELARCLASLSSQSRTPDEVIVVDNASRDGRTREVALAAGVTYVREDRPGLDRARNTGLLATRSEILVYTDDDTELHPRWFEQMVSGFDGEQVMAVTGLVLPARLDTEAQWLFETHWSFSRGFEPYDYGPEFYQAFRARGCPAWLIGAGASMAFRRAVVEKVGLFDERLDVGASGCSGDSEYWYRILAAGYTCRYVPSAVVFHHHRLDLTGLSGQIFNYMRGHVSALLVQYERTGDRGNLWRLFISLPVYYTRRALGRLRKGRRSHNYFLKEEVTGSLSGLIYYLRTEKPR